MGSGRSHLGDALPQQPEQHGPRAAGPRRHSCPGLYTHEEVPEESERERQEPAPNSHEAARGHSQTGTNKDGAPAGRAKAAPARGGGGLAERRKFQRPAIVSNETKDSRSRKKIRKVTNLLNVYMLGTEIMPSCHRGMQVLEAVHRESGRAVVMKVRMKSNSFACKSEEQEWRCSTEFMLNLPPSSSIAQIYEVLEDQTAYYVVMEKVCGKDLFESINGHRTLPAEEVKDILRQILIALGTLHSKGCIHKDVKLENVMLDRSTLQMKGASPGTSPVRVKLIDFDTVEGFEPATPKRTKDVLGTDQYIAQEAYDGNYSPASDIFAAGVIVYRLLTGKFPFGYEIFNDEAGENWVGSPKMQEIRQKLCNVKIDWSHKVFSFEPEGRNLVRSMLAVNEMSRPTAADALVHPWLMDGMVHTGPRLDARSLSPTSRKPAREQAEHPFSVGGDAAEEGDQTAAPPSREA